MQFDMGFSVLQPKRLTKETIMGPWSTVAQEVVLG